MNDPKRVAVVGAGRIGSAFAFHLSRAGHEVTVIARGARFEALRREGAIVAVDGTRAAVHVTNAIVPSEPYDLLLVTVMAHQIDDLVPSLAESRAKTVLFMFNTFEKLDRWRAAIGSERFEVGFPNMISFLVDGKLPNIVDGPGMVTTLSSASWAARLEAAAMPAEVEPDMESYLRSHAAFFVPLMVAAWWTWERAKNLTWSEARRLSAAFQEGCALVRSLGHTLKPRAVSVVAALPGFMITAMIWAFSRSKANRDLGELGPAEARVLIDSMAAAASGPTPALSAIRP